jgi:hypothetical protein
VTTPFRNPLTGAQGKLARALIQSPDFSIADQTGWAIMQDGSAFFFNITASGVITAAEFEGTDFIIDQAGIFMYNGPI